MTDGPAFDVDFLVVGGGPAGSACAIRLAQAGARVAIVESSDFSRFRIGETLEPSLGPALAHLGVELEEQNWSAACRGITATWGQSTAARRPTIFNAYGKGWCVDRRKFDRALFDQARRAGAIALSMTRVTSAHRQNGRWVCELRTEQEAVPVAATWLVAATGRAGKLPFAVNSSRAWIDRLVGAAVVDNDQRNDHHGMAGEPIVEAASSGWWYCTSLPDGSRVAIFFTDADILPKGNARRAAFLLDQHKHSPQINAAWPFITALIEQHRWTGFDARSSISRIAASDGWVAVGDALMAFDPLCGRGVTEAVASGCEVASWLLQPSSPAPDRGELPGWVRKAADRFNRYRQQRRQIYAREMRWPQSTFWRRRHLS